MGNHLISLFSPLAEVANVMAGLRGWVRDNGPEVKIGLAVVVIFLAVFFMPVGQSHFDNAILEGLQLVHWYAREHVILCLLPAFLIAGAIAVFIQQQAVLNYLGPNAPKILAFGVASVSGTLLAVCSCTVLPLFGGIYRRGAGLGPAIAFLYSGPAINILAIMITAKVLGPELGIARAVGAVAFAVVVGGVMHWLYRREEQNRATAGQQHGLLIDEAGESRSLAEVGVFFALLVGILVFANWAPAAPEDSALWHAIHTGKWPLTAGLAVGLAVFLVWRWRWTLWPVVAVSGVVAALSLMVPQQAQLAFVAGVIGLAVLAARQPGAGADWFSQSWDFAKQILPLLLVGVLIAGFLLGRPGAEGIIPSTWIGAAVGGNSLSSNFLASLVGAFMYFATLTEVPIVQGLLGAGMGKGPALALLLAGPALSLPNMLVIRSIIGTEKTLVYCGLVILMATVTGLLYGTFWP